MTKNSEPTFATKYLFLALCLGVALFMGFGTTSCSDEFAGHEGGTLACTGHAPEQIQVYTFNGALTKTKLMMAVREPNQSYFLPGYSCTHPDYGPCQFRNIKTDPTECAPFDLAISSYSGAMQFISTERMQMLRIDKAQAELVWESTRGSAPTEDTFFTEEWQRFLLDLVDCSSFARASATCHVARDLPPYTVGLLKDVNNNDPKGDFLNEATMLFLVWRTK